MFSNRVIDELQSALQTGNDTYEIQSPSGKTFTVHLQQGRAEQLRSRQESFGEERESNAQSQQAQEWRVRRVPQQQIEEQD